MQDRRQDDDRLPYGVAGIAAGCSINADERRSEQMEAKMVKAEAAWSGDFGNSYTKRNGVSDAAIAARTSMWKEILPLCDPASILEVGANIGLNLRALRSLSDADLYATEPSGTARMILARDKVLPFFNTRPDLAEKIGFPDGLADLAFTCGVLIHVPPARLLDSCREIHRCSRRWIACIEYFSAEPQSKTYRGEEGLLFTRDFGAFWLDNFPDLLPVANGFFWKRTTRLDNLNWWLFEKQPRT